ncbi:MULTISPECIES: hypothetical protein [Xanthomonas]|uniref:hypothetical protein n=1 Tax=Xanthomonas TaxID=338 RepID=UPI0012654C40|nr:MULTISPECIES: hypothetical protein [Xanthomonas]
MDAYTVIVALTSAGLSAIVTFLISRHIFVQRISNTSNRPDGVLNLRLRDEFNHGVAFGRAEELARFSISYEPFSELHEEWMGMKKRARLGYGMQISYNGFPVGHQTRYVTHSNIEYNQENIDRLLNNEVATAVSAIAQLVATKGIGTKTLPRKVL